MRRSGAMLAAVLLAAAALAVAGDARAAERIGVASVVKNEVSGTLGGRTRVLDVGAGVFHNEVIATQDESSTQLLFRDETSLTVGPRSRVTLDRFVYDPNTGAGDVVVNAVEGTFRFVSGSARSDSYKIETPVATIGLRGTVLEWRVDADGNMLLVVVDGGVTVTLADGRQVAVDEGEYIVVSMNGDVSGPRAWTGPMLNRGAVFQFVLDRLNFDDLPKDMADEFNDALDSLGIDLEQLPPDNDDCIECGYDGPKARGEPPPQ